MLDWLSNWWHARSGDVLTDLVSGLVVAGVLVAIGWLTGLWRSEYGFDLAGNRTVKRVFDGPVSPTLLSQTDYQYDDLDLAAK